MTVSIIGIGSWLPDEIRTNDAWPSNFGERAHAAGDRTFNDIPESEDPVAAAILARDLAAESADLFLGAKQRRVAPETTTAAEAETHAACAALTDAGVNGGDVDLVLSNSIVPDRMSLPSAVSVARAVGAHRAIALGIEAMCASALAQIDVARAYIEAGLANVVLLTQSHLMLRTFPLAHPASPGLGDAATALVVAKRPGLAVRSTFGVTHGEHAVSVAWVRGIDDDTDPPWWKAGGNFRLGSRAPAGAKYLMRETVSFGALTVQKAAERSGIDVERLSVLASVQPRGFIPGAIAERLGLPRDRAVTTYDTVAHVGACGPVLNLDAARRLGRLTPGALVGMYAQGAGFTRYAAVLEMS
jgi:3-oxoacyl-[acyl-carrier-protein] synthase-3